MADDRVQGNAAPDPTGITGTPPRVEPAGHVQAQPPASVPAASALLPLTAVRSEVEQLLRWLLGVFILLFSAWGVGLLMHYVLGSLIASILFPLLTFGAFLYMEKHNFWLSRQLGLRVGPRSSYLVSALFLWAFGLVALLLRSSGNAQATEQAADPQASADTSSVREVVETVVFVVVLVLLLKSFIAEAFVIPTGSMAETLWGYQKVVTCPSCQYKFPVNCSMEVDPQDGPSIPVTGCTCPNCRLHIRMVPDGRPDTDGRPLPARTGVLTFDQTPAGPSDPGDPNRRSQAHPLAGEPFREIPDPGWNSGDRVLVGKFLYELGSPQRLDVVVFKYPAGPQKNHVPMNYIKRLIGLPGETIAIHRGDIYHLPAERMNWTYDDSDVPAKDLWNPRNTTDPRHSGDDRAVALFRQKQFQIIRKPPPILLAMMRIVYDNDFQAADLKEVQRWAPEDGAWAAAEDNKVFRHGAQVSEGDKVAWLSYRHLLRGDSKPTLIRDFMGYNHEEHDGWDRYRREWVSLVQRPNDGYNWVGDLVVESEVEVEKAEGTLVLQLSRGADRFRATFDLASGVCTLSRVTLEFGKDKEEKLASQPTKLKKGKYQVRFANVDERLTVWVDNDLPFGDGVTYEGPKEVGPKVNDLTPVRLGVGGGAVLSVRHLKLYRDTYYTANHSSPAENRPEGDDFGNPDSWGPLRRDMPVQTYYVQPGHYFCMGDNSTASADSREWGLVPQRLMLGRALLVYYPLGRAGRIR